MEKAWPGAPDLSDVTLPAQDEFAVRKGHRYATIFVETARKRVLWVWQGRGVEDIGAVRREVGGRGPPARARPVRASCDQLTRGAAHVRS
jgi:hypothetical protein